MKLQVTGALAVILTTTPFFASGAPAIDGLSGNARDGSIITINGSGFGNKPHAKPYFWWSADEGPEPSKLGRKQSWDKSFNGERTRDVTAPHSTYSYKFDHGRSTGPALGAVKFDSNQIFLWRKTYEDFEATDSIAIRSRLNDVNGKFFPGQQVTGQSSGATGFIESVKPASKNRIALYFQKGKGSIAKSNPVDFIYGEKMSTDTGSATNVEGSRSYPTGTFRTFNFKTLRFWNDIKKNNAYPTIQGAQGDTYNINLEGTNESIWNSTMKKSLSQKPKTWKVEELIYQSSDIDVSNGVFNYTINHDRHYDKDVVTQTEQRNAPYNIVYQSQVSNGAQMNTNMYYDSIYIDDTWHRVMLCDSPTWNQCDSAEIQIPQSWSNEKVKLILNTAGLRDHSKILYLYIFDGSNNVNNNGYPICIACPSSTGMAVQ